MPVKTLLAATPFALVLFVATSTAITFDVSLDSSQEVPAPNLNGASPSGTASLEVNTITGAVTVDGSYSGTTSDVMAAHLHGLAAPGQTAGVIFGLNVSGGMSGTLTGSSTLSSDDLSGLLAGQTYLNVHTADNGPGEIRGQVVDQDIKVFSLTLDAEQEVPSPTLNGSTPTGSATVVVDTSSGEVEVSGTYSGMTSDVVSAHLHGLAATGQTAGVIFGFDVSGGTSGTFAGADTLSSENLAGLLAGQTYLNVHTMDNGPGEIRAQVPEPGMSGLFLVGILTWLVQRRRAQLAR